MSVFKKHAAHVKPKASKAEEEAFQESEAIFVHDAVETAPKATTASEFLRSALGYLEAHPGGSGQRQFVADAKAFLTEWDKE